MSHDAALSLADFVKDEGLAREFWDALRSGRLQFQRCRECASAWLPPRDQCPRCWKSSWDWDVASGSGRLVSWVVYHRPFHPAFTHRVPYNVSIVQLDEGPRLVTNVNSDGEPLRIDAPVDLSVEEDGGVVLARFTLRR